MKDRGILLDSDIIIWLLRDNVKVKGHLKELYQNTILYTTPITVAEIWAGARKNETDIINELFKSIEVLSINKEIGRIAGEWMHKYQKSHSVELADSLIGACTLFYELKLWTMNIKHYPMLKKDFLHTF